MIKGILFDWHGVLVESNNIDKKRTKIIYNKLLNNTATKDEIIEIVSSYKKYEPLWELLPTLKKHFKMCVVNNGPKITYNYWDEYYGYSEFMDFVNSEIEGVEKPQPEIYKIACRRLGINTDEVIYMDDSCGFPEETDKLNMKFIHWDSTENGFNKFKQYLIKHTKVIL
ncbi:HAD-IA family hydrolase (plasmid) [Clostridium estertheticum]|uniref:HAD family hydrolase n=1 Tax=Clostridium estertheticum TaxID=238834 RepID=UPI001C7DCEDA|nr:HAD-IA family hydrolase [Clostridium estertheticum]MBX4262164.1 HAD-IA family hydrolase [Clostridium estertheticum]WLC73192.1 HAD-IA family hydrolase [Clostridium estertheticum]